MSNTNAKDTFKFNHRHTKEELLGRRKKLINNTNIPQHTIESIARRLLPVIMAYYQSEEGQREFAEWKAEQEKLKTSKDNNSGKSV